MKRRQFLQWSTLATASSMLPGFLKALDGPGRLPGGARSLVVLQLSGGNDGLNTVIPVRNDVYFRERPRLAIARTDALALSDEAGLHPSLTALKALYEEGHLAILNAVGYPNPDHSHFRSMDIWQTASGSDEYRQTGWLGRYLDAQCAGCDKPTQGLEIDDILSLAMKGERMKGLALKDPARLYDSVRDPYTKAIAGASHGDGQPVSYLYKTLAETVSGAGYIYAQSRANPSAATYPDSGCGRSFKTIASLVRSGINTRVYYVSLGSFDTHVNQEATQARLFTQMNDALKAFTDDLKGSGHFGDVLILTFSEFGRRVAQNASGGTDHGTANNMFVIGGGLKKAGLLNPMADLGQLVEGDLAYQIDFRQVYATVLNKWLGANETRVLGAKYPLLDFI